ncbi:MAG: hypothetical protein NVS4B6_13230 [Mycobacterium sp.]
MPDGTIILKAPTGHLYSTQPHGAALFPTLAQSTGALPPPPAINLPDSLERSAMMARRKHTREQNRQDRITQERRRIELIAEQERQRQARLADTYEPPPF